MEENKYKRRERYKGTHPSKFNQKYKEHDPLKYQDTILKVIEKGNTPAGMHIPICVKEILDILNIKENERGIDCTLGYGGHTTEILKKLNHTGHLYSLDQDPIEINKTRERINAKGFTPNDFTAININFKDVASVALEYGKVDFLMADLGVSSMQIDNPERGFSYKNEGPLDLRMNPNEGVPAYERLKELTKDEIEGMLIENADEPYARKIAEAIYSHLSRGKQLETTTQLKDLITSTLDFLHRSTREQELKKIYQRVFQAIRIDVNQEYEVLFELLENLPETLNSGARVAILTFHSGEDRLVKKAFNQYFKDGVFSSISDGPIRPSMDEQVSNPRSKSAKLRWAIKA